MRTVRLGWVLILLAGAVPAGADVVTGQVEWVGLPSGTPAGSVMRFGQWVPIRVRLAMQGTGTFTRALRVEARDLDGDRVAYLSQPVTLASEGGSTVRTAWCYAAANSIDELPDYVTVLDGDHVVDRLPLPGARADMLLNDDLLVLDISDAAIASLKRLETQNFAPGDRAEGARDFYRNVVIARLPARDLPDEWWGLELADAIFWDLPNADDLKRPVLLSTLVEWVKNGGQLVIGVGANWDALQSATELADLLPLKGTGQAITLPRLTYLRARVGLQTDRELESPIAATIVPTVVPGALRTCAEFSDNGAFNLISMRLVGSGRVVLCAASVRELAEQVRGREPRFFAEFLELNAFTPEFKESQLNGLQVGLNTTNPLFNRIVGETGFAARSVLLSLLAFLFVGAYVLLASVGSWAWLRSRRLGHLSWSVFAGLAVATSVLSLVTVRGLQGVVGGVRSVSVVDLEAGDHAARGPCWFGYRSPDRTRTAVTLPSADGESYVRSLARIGMPSYYVTPASYDARPGRARLDDVLVRATVKQFEGHWTGALEGTVRADLTVDRGSGRVTPESWISNDLGADLRDCWLIYVDPRSDDAGVPRAAGRTRIYAGLPTNHDPTERELVESRMEADWDKATLPPAMNILVVNVGALRNGARASELGRELYATLARRWTEWAAQNKPKRSGMPDLPTLWAQQMRWRSSGDVLDAVLLAGTRSYYLNSLDDHQRALTMGIPTLDGLPPLDVSHWLTGGTVVERTLYPGTGMLVGVSNRPGPAVLQLDGRPRPAFGGSTVYRVRVPIAYTGTPPRAR